MRIGIGLPTSTADAGLAEQVACAKRAEAAGFASVAAIDRLAHDCLEPLITLAAVGAVTSRVRLATTVLVAPNRINAALLAKQVATLDLLSGGRVDLGLGVGVREDDYTLGGADPRRRGREMDRMVDELRRIWRGETAVGPPPAQAGGPPLTFGGTSPAAIRRVATVGDGWICGGGGVRLFTRMAEKVRTAWQAQQRDGEPVLSAFVNVATGPEAVRTAPEQLGAFYAFAGTYAQRVIDDAALGPAAVAAEIAAHAAAGCDELILAPTSADPDEVDRLAEIVESHREGGSRG
jgi:alkanesulfonate monooxygenase SsuD/methylene tetrahydromethanopterin reductase-like flavin-dependent oxidoreductase (luciferase family)